MTLRWRQTPNQKWPGVMQKVARRRIPKVAAKPMKGTYEEEPMTLSGPSGDGPYLVILDEEKLREERGIQEEGEVEKSITLP